MNLTPKCSVPSVELPEDTRESMPLHLNESASRAIMKALHACALNSVVSNKDKSAHNSPRPEFSADTDHRWKTFRGCLDQRVAGTAETSGNSCDLKGLLVQLQVARGQGSHTGSHSSSHLETAAACSPWPDCDKLPQEARLTSLTAPGNRIQFTTESSKCLTQGVCSMADWKCPPTF